MRVQKKSFLIKTIPLFSFSFSYQTRNLYHNLNAFLDRSISEWILVEISNNNGVIAFKFFCFFFGFFFFLFFTQSWLLPRNHNVAWRLLLIMVWTEILTTRKYHGGHSLRRTYHQTMIHSGCTRIIILLLLNSIQIEFFFSILWNHSCLIFYSLIEWLLSLSLSSKN
jgi:hypothetical protein